MRASVIYTFVGAGLPFADLSSEPVAFQLVVPSLINTPLNGSLVDFTCAQFVSSTNCDPAAEQSFSYAGVQGAFSAQIAFEATDDAAYTFFFPTGAFDTSGVYTTDPSAGNPGTLTVSPEPATVLLAVSGLCFCGLSRLLTKRSTATRMEQRIAQRSL
jgi:hypothetical protein